MLLQRLLERGNGAVRQREAAAHRGLRGVLELLAGETTTTSGQVEHRVARFRAAAHHVAA
jgi:hypothetical protein